MNSTILMFLTSIFYLLSSLSTYSQHFIAVHVCCSLAKPTHLLKEHKFSQYQLGFLRWLLCFSCCLVLNINILLSLTEYHKVFVGTCWQFIHWYRFSQIWMNCYSSYQPFVYRNSCLICPSCNPNLKQATYTKQDFLENNVKFWI